jgi:hypothetical protein
MRAAFFATALILTASLPAPDQEPDECRHEAQRSATLNAQGARMLAVSAGSGSLKITGKPGINQVIVRGRACASHADLLSSITLAANRRGDDVIIEANNRDRNNHNWGDDEYARLDVTIEVPARMAAEIADGSGSIDISNLGAVRIDDGSGEIVGNDLQGDVRIEDGSGSIRLIDVAGRVNIDDGSGGISLRNIGGAIDIDDSSGEISVRVARSSVRINDSSGDIDVVDVDGDFVVVDDSSGSIDYDNVRGRVDIPRRRR